MKRFGILFLLFFSVLFFCFKVNVSYASQKSTDSSYISVINLIRGKELGHENDDLLSSFKAQWQVTSEQKVNATWLLQYSVLEDNQIMDFAKNKTKNQEFGLLLEIDRNFARKSNVLYRGQGPSYFSDGLLLVSYDLSERKKLIDTSFKKFKSVFGYYPKTVGAWWIGADSISYMQEKYGIVAALKASDQFNLDVYSIWGTPFSIPYLSSKENEGIPAESFDKSSKVVILQWAARDPLLGYQDSTYSIQDYALKGYDASYAKYLMENYLKNPGSNVVVGLENGGTLNTFQKYYKDMLNLSNNLKKENKAIVSTAKDYANKFLSEKSVFPKNSTLLFKDYKTNDQAFWYNSQNYRIFIQKIKDKIFLADFRDYSTKVNEDFSFLPNSQGDLKITEPSIVDSVRFSDSKVLLKKNSSVLSVVESKGLTLLYSGKQVIGSFAKDNVQLGSKKYDFKSENNGISLFTTLLVFYFFYFVFILLLTINHRVNFFYSLILLLPLYFSISLLGNERFSDITFLLDKKELQLFYIFPFIKQISIRENILIFKLIPIIILLFSNLAFILNQSKRYFKYFYFSILFLITLIYLHFSYFPLDKSTYISVAIFFLFFATLLFISLFYFFKKKKSKKSSVAIAFISTIIVVSMILIAVFTSRTRIVITPFELSAMQFIKDRHIDVLFEYKSDSSPTPIYKAVKPFLLENYKFAENITKTKWDLITRPKNNVLSITNYKNKLIVVPRYLGVDLSLYEMKTLNLKKVFDNAQIAIFEEREN